MTFGECISALRDKVVKPLGYRNYVRELTMRVLNSDGLIR